VACLLTGFRPVESYSGARETVIAGPYQSTTTSFRMGQDGDAKDVDGEKTWGGVATHHPTRGVGSIVSSPRAMKMDFMYI